MIELAFQLILLALLFVASALFSGSETALFSLSRLDLRRLRRERNPQADTLHELLDQPRRLIIAILCGNQVVNVAATAILTGVLVTLYGVERAAFITTVVMVPLLLLLGEATPKTIAISDPARVSTRIVTQPATSARTSSAATSASTSCCTGAPVPTSSARRQPPPISSRLMNFAHCSTRA